MESYRICMASEILDVGASFFDRMKEIRNEKVGDTFFITIENGDGTLTFSIHENEYERAKIDARDSMIEKILDSRHNI